MYAIAAVDQNWGIGRDNALLFHISADMKRFRALTEGKTVLMGRKTLQSLPNGRGLPHRRNIVLTGDRDFAAEMAEIVHFPVEAVVLAGEDAWIIGGESVYRRFLPLCDRVYLTKIFADGHADAFFPDLDSDPHWQVDTESEIMEDNGLRYQFVEYVPAAPEEDDLLLSEEEAPQATPQIAPPADITVNGTPMAQLDVDNYQLDLDLTQGQTLTLGGADAFTPAWINPDFFEAASATSVKLVPVTGKYRITANLATRVIDALVLNADGSGLATLSDDGHGAVYFIGYGISSPAAVNEPGWTTEKGVCVPESAPGIYTMTAQAGLEGSTTLGQRFRVSGWSGKFFRNRGWDGLGAFTLAPGAEAFFSIAGDGNIEIASGVTLEEGATYRLTLDVTAGKDNPVLSLVKI